MTTLATAPAPPLGRHNPRLRRLRAIVRGDEPNLTVADGVKLVRDLAGSGVRIEEIYASPRHAELLANGSPIARAVGRGEIHIVDEGALDHLAPSRSSQGILAVVAVPRHAIEARGIVVYLEDVQDPGNVGAAIRSAAAFGAAAVACSAACASPFSPRALRASAGHSLRLPVTADAPLSPLADSFHAAGGEVVATTGDDGVALPQWRARLPLLLVMGNEGAGLSAETLGSCDHRVRIPMAAGVESLNIAVAAGVILAYLAGVAGSPILDVRATAWRPS